MSLPFVWLVDVLRDAGLDVVPYKGWETRTAGTKTRATWGVLCHHDAAPATSSRKWVTPRMIAEGHSLLPGPIAQLCITDDCKVHVIAAGSANHAGRGRIPGTLYTDGNARLLGIEVNNDGVGEQWGTPLLRTYLTTVAACLNHLGLDSSRAIAHKEYAPTRKIDPAGPWAPSFAGPGLSWAQMGRWRQLVAERQAELLAPAQPAPAPSPTLRRPPVFLASLPFSTEVWLITADGRRRRLTPTAAGVLRRRPEFADPPMVLTREELDSFPEAP